MRLLLIHADRIRFQAKKAIKRLAEDLESTTGEQDGLEETLVAFCTIESGDEGNPEGIIENAVATIRDHADQVKVERVFVYPYAHLSDDLASPKFATDLTIQLTEALTDAGFETKRSPFGWYKSFQLEAKGHPLAELSRTITAEGEGSELEVEAGTDAESAAVAKETQLAKEWKILTTDGELVDPDDFDFTDHADLEALYQHEAHGSRKAKGKPAHVELMQELELVDYEPGADAGNFRWYPKGALVKRLIEAHVSEIAGEFGGMRVETPIMYDYEHPALKKYLDRFPARQYILKSEDKEYFLRFAACFGQYLIAHDMTLSYRHLPARLYELTHYSFRREQTGELSGLRRLRTFTMPDMHTIVRDVDQAKEEFLAQYRESARFMADLDLPYYPALRFVRSFYEENQDLAAQLVETIGKPALVELWDDRFFYFVMKFEFNVVDTQGKASALSTVQIDVENCERFDITYTNEEGQKATPLILHASFSGSVDRDVYALLETAARRAGAGEKPSLPYWLSPTQVRFIPVSDDFVPHCLELAGELDARADVDDRDETVGRRIRDAEKEWVPIIIVVGDRELDSGEYPVRARTGEERELDREGLQAHVRELQGGLPTEPLPLPVRVSARPIFRG